MGLLDGLLKLLGLQGREGPSPEATPLRLFSTLFLENYAFLAGRAAALEARSSSFEAWEAAFTAEARVSVLNVHEGATRPSAWLFFGKGAVAGLREAYLRSRPGNDASAEGAASLQAELGAVDILAESLGEAFAIDGAEASLSYDIVEPGALQLYRWLLRDGCFLEFSSESWSFFLVVESEAYESLLSRLARPLFMEGLLGRSRPGAAAAIGRIRNEELRIESGRDFPLASILAPRRLVLGFGEAKVQPRALLLCADATLIEARVGSGYRALLRFSSAARSIEVPLYFLASAIGPFERGAEEWRTLLLAAATRCAASLARLFRLEAAVSGTSAISSAEALARGPVSAISYNVSLGGAKGRMILAFGPDFLSIAASRLFGPDEAERLRLSARNLFLAIESLNARVASASFAGYRRSLAAVPASASLIASRLPVGGRPLYSLLEELREKDIAAILGRLAQKGFMRREDRYAFFLHASAASPAGKGDLLTAATPCQDYESLFARFPKRWDEADGSRPRMYPSFASLDDMLEAHYEAAWLLYRELLADRLALSRTGEAVLRASGEAFAARLRDALGEQGRSLESLVRALGAEARNALPWADRARELCGLSGVARALEPSIGHRAAEALRDEILSVDRRLADGREDAYAIWKGRRAFAAELDGKLP